MSLLDIHIQQRSDWMPNNGRTIKMENMRKRVESDVTINKLPLPPKYGVWWQADDIIDLMGECPYPIPVVVSDGTSGYVLQTQDIGLFAELAEMEVNDLINLIEWEMV